MSFKYRIAATIFVLEIALIGSVLWMTLGHSMDSIHRQIASTEAVTLQLLGDLSRSALLTDEYANLQTFIEGTRRDPRVQSVVIGDARGRVVAATDVGLIGAPFPRLSDRQHGYWRRTEVLGRGGPLGALAIEFSDYPLVIAYRDTRNLGITIAITGMAAIAVVGLAMGFFLTRRLEKLAVAADRVAGGDLALRVAVQGRDEVARVGGAFNSMVARLAVNLDELRAARDRLVQPTEAMSEGFALWDADDRLVLYNSKLQGFFRELGEGIALGVRFEDLSRSVHQHLLVDDADLPRVEAWLAERLAHRRTPRGPWEMQLRDGRWLAVSEFGTQDGGTVEIYSDVTESKRRQQALEQSEQRLQAMMDAVIDGIVTVAGDGRVESANPAAERIFGCAPGALVGLDIGELVADSALRDLERASTRSAIDLAALPRHRLLEMVGRRRGADSFAIELSVTELDLHGRRTFILTVRDITARKAAEELVRHHATHDALTNLPNRALFEDRLAGALKHSARHGDTVAVMFLDLDRFKIINDTLGHSIGDALLIALGRRLRASVRDEDTVARMGGDEFIFVLGGLKSAEDAVKPAQKILEAIRPPFHIHGHELHVTASIGIGLYPGDGLGSDQLLKCADMALYRAKERGRNRLQLYNPTLNVRVVGQMVLEKHLRHALERDQFQLVYQPQVALDSGQVVGVEALIRWRHPELGLISPEDFVPLAEDNGLIEPLGLWVLRTACTQYRAWREEHLSGLRLAVNMSARQFQRSGLEARIREVLAETGMEARWLELELTESVLMQEGDSTAGLLESLSACGISLALDDFGTGYSSLSYLKRFPIKRVKIDRSFVRDINTNEGDAALARAVIAMAHGLGVDVVAEGIESLEQLAKLRRYGCDEGQGYFLGRPVVPSEVPQLVRRHRWPQVRSAVSA
ncbi:MAG TPA: EAL domain-containing protein [Geminicoccaceae bacterium]|nr:EAL domain-containing protein [Geminicoccaceae bacterium]